MPNKLTVEEFINRSIEINGDRYNYDKVIYKNMNTKVILHCNKHDLDFLQKPTMHLHQKGGCPSCARESSIKSRLKGKQHFVDLVIQKYGDIYDFSMVPDDIRKEDEIVVKCKLCNSEINTTFDRLLIIKRCINCFPKTNTFVVNSKEQFVEFCNKLFNNKYDYSKVDYINNNNKVTVRCPIHDYEWDILPSSHMRGRGCKKCGYENLSEKTLNTFEYYLSKFYDVHGDKYDYSKSEYINSHTPILIQCKNGHEFYQTPNKHTKGANCPYCLGRHKTQEEFIEQAQKENNNRYTYEKTVYINNHTKVIVTCPKHGDFMVTPMNHIKKGQPRGCRLCTESRGEMYIRSYLENNNIKFKTQYWFEDCRYILPLPFDFAIFNEDDTIKFLIEHQGQQHFQPVRFGGISDQRAANNLNIVNTRDVIKDEYCIKNSIPLLKINYDEISNIPELIESFVVNSPNNSNISILNRKQHYINLILEKFGDIYDFELVPDDISRFDQITVICKKCGNKINTKFQTILSRKQCRICQKHRNKYNVYNQEEFINFCNNLFDCKYDYSKVEFKDLSTKVTVFCPEHNHEWKISPSCHMKGEKCRLCANESTSKKLTKDFEYYLNRFREIHGDEFDYSESVFIDKKTPILIKCKHGHEFWMTPIRHIEGKKCKFCNKMKKSKPQD